jgi:hypothetical protein
MSGITKSVVALAAGLIVTGAVSVDAQTRRGNVIIVPRPAIVRPFFYDPFWGPWYPYGYTYAYAGRPETDIKTHVTPKNAEVYVGAIAASGGRD